MITGERPEADDEEAVDKYLNVELILDVGSSDERRGHVTKCSRVLDGEAVGRAHANPLFDTMEYDIEFTYGSVDNDTANIISENMFAQVDDEGKQYFLMNEITDQRKDNTAIPIYDGITRGRSGK